LSNRYLVRPKADEDLDEQAYYYASKATPEVGHRFLMAAHETFNLLATQPEMGWRPRLRHPALASLRVFRVNGFKNIIILYLPVAEGVEILRVISGSRSLEALLSREGLE
jgi:toxin ParE1/3/4